MNRLLLTVLVLFSFAQVDAETAEEKGLAIILEAERLDTGWSDLQADMEMILRGKQGQESGRTLRIRNLEMAGDGDKMLTIFDTPRDIRGTAFLSFTHAVEPDDQWLYLPALKRVKRIASANKSGPFMGSEFAYEDLSSDEVEKFGYKWLRDEVIDGHEVFVIERVPLYAYSGYARQLVWLDKTIYRSRKVEFYDRKGAKLKTLTNSGYRQYLERYWRPDQMHMFNHQTKKSTLLVWRNYRFQTGLHDGDFNKNVLKRVR